MPRTLYVWEEELVQLLHEAVIMQPPEGVTVAMALDWYRQGEESTSGVPPYTTVGRLLHDSKYWRDPDLPYLNKWEADIAQRIARFVARHRLYLRADAIAAVPGSGIGRGYSDRIATKTAALTGHRLIRPTSMTLDRPSRKSGIPFDLTQEFAFDPEEVDGKTVIVMDDLIHAGETMRGVALGARRAGARYVLGLAISRTLSD